MCKYFVNSEFYQAKIKDCEQCRGIDSNARIFIRPKLITFHRNYFLLLQFRCKNLIIKLCANILRNENFIKQK